MDDPGETHWMAMKRVVGYMKGQPRKGLQMTKPVELRMVALADADYAKDPVERKSVGGDIHTLGGCITSFFPSSHRNNHLHYHYKSTW